MKRIAFSVLAVLAIAVSAPLFAGDPVEVREGIKITPTTAAKPTCDAALRSTIWRSEGGAGVADATEVCQKDAADTYAWTALGGSGTAAIEYTVLTTGVKTTLTVPSSGYYICDGSATKIQLPAAADDSGAVLTIQNTDGNTCTVYDSNGFTVLFQAVNVQVIMRSDGSSWSVLRAVPIYTSGTNLVIHSPNSSQLLSDDSIVPTGASKYLGSSATAWAIGYISRIDNPNAGAYGGDLFLNDVVGTKGVYPYGADGLYDNGTALYAWRDLYTETVQNPNGVLTLNDDVEVVGTFKLPTSISATPTEPVTCDASNEGIMVYVRDTDSCSGEVCVCEYTGSAYDWTLGGHPTVPCSII